MKSIVRAYAIAWFFILGCASPSDTMTSGVPSISTSTTIDGRAIKVRSRVASRQSDRLLGHDERRVAVFVVPGDAVVEVDGQIVDRRDGVVELIGKVGEIHRVRASLGGKSTETKVVIDDAGANPSFVDVNEEKPKSKTATATKKPATFDLNE